VDHREARNQGGGRRTIRNVLTGEEQEVSYRVAVGLVSRGKAEFVQAEQEKPKRTRKAAKKVSAETVYADPEAPLDTAPDPKPDLPSPTSGDAADSGSNSPDPVF